MREETNSGSKARQLHNRPSCPSGRRRTSWPGWGQWTGRGCLSWRLQVASPRFLIHPRFRLFATFPGRVSLKVHSQSYTQPTYPAPHTP